MQYNTNNNGLWLPTTTVAPQQPTVVQPSVAAQVAAAVSAQQPTQAAVASFTPAIVYNGSVTVTARLGSGNWAFNALLAAFGYITAPIANACNVGGAIGACSKWLHTKGVAHTYYTVCATHGGKGCIHASGGSNAAMLALVNGAAHTHAPSPYCLPCLVALYTPTATVAAGSVPTQTQTRQAAATPTATNNATPTTTQAPSGAGTAIVMAGGALYTAYNTYAPVKGKLAFASIAKRNLANNTYAAAIQAGNNGRQAAQAAYNASPWQVVPLA